MKALRTLTACALLAAAAVATAVAEERIETITVTAKPIRASVPTVEKVPPAPVERVAVPMPTDMPEADIDYHMPLIGTAALASLEQTES